MFVPNNNSTTDPEIFERSVLVYCVSACTMTTDDAAPTQASSQTPIALDAPTETQTAASILIHFTA
jgi:hypothetical protein